MQILKFDKKIDLLSIDNGKPRFKLIGKLDADACLQLKNRFNFLNISEVILSVIIKKIFSDSWELTGNLQARITQSCVVTCKPVKEILDIELEERYVLQNKSVALINEINVSASNIEVLETSMLEIGELIAQIIGVESESFPKIKNTPETLFFGNEDTKVNPFAKLAVIKK